MRVVWTKFIYENHFAIIYNQLIKYEQDQYSYYNSLMGYYILIFELFIIIFFGIFVRTGNDTVSTFSDI